MVQLQLPFEPPFVLLFSCTVLTCDLTVLVSSLPPLPYVVCTFRIGNVLTARPCAAEQTSAKDKWFARYFGTTQKIPLLGYRDCTARHGTARHSSGTARHSTALHGRARHGTAQHGEGKAQHGTARHGTVQQWHSTA